MLRNVVSAKERKYIMDMARPKLKPSTVATEKVLDTKNRVSETAWLDNNDPVISEVIARCMKHVDRPVRNCESLQVLRYKEGGFYKFHQDSLGGKNQRMYTFIVALNDDFEGGETRFPNIDTSYKLNAGDVLLFDCLNNYEYKDYRALHGGLPVTGGEKWICNLWVHKREYKP
jgi:prolyl 4-hydroxylase